MSPHANEKSYENGENPPGEPVSGRVGRWRSNWEIEFPPSSHQTVRAVFPHTAFRSFIISSKFAPQVFKFVESVFVIECPLIVMFPDDSPLILLSPGEEFGNPLFGHPFYPLPRFPHRHVVEIVLPASQHRVCPVNDLGIAAAAVPPDRLSELLPDPVQGFSARFHAEVLLLFPARLLADREAEEIEACLDGGSDGLLLV